MRRRRIGGKRRGRVRMMRRTTWRRISRAMPPTAAVTPGSGGASYIKLGAPGAKITGGPGCSGVNGGPLAPGGVGIIGFGLPPGSGGGGPMSSKMGHGSSACSPGRKSSGSSPEPMVPGTGSALGGGAGWMGGPAGAGSGPPDAAGTVAPGGAAAGVEWRRTNSAIAVSTAVPGATG